AALQFQLGDIECLKRRQGGIEQCKRPFGRRYSIQHRLGHGKPAHQSVGGDALDGHGFLIRLPKAQRQRRLGVLLQNKAVVGFGFLFLVFLFLLLFIFLFILLGVLFLVFLFQPAAVHSDFERRIV